MLALGGGLAFQLGRFVATPLVFYDEAMFAGVKWMWVVMATIDRILSDAVGLVEVHGGMPAKYY